MTTAEAFVIFGILAIACLVCRSLLSKIVKHTGEEMDAVIIDRKIDLTMQINKSMKKAEKKLGKDFYTAESAIAFLNREED